YIISGCIGGIVYFVVRMIITFVVVHPQFIMNSILLLPFLFILATGIAGLAAFFASISRVGEIYWTYAQALQVSMVTISTIFYPASTIAQYLPGPIVT